MKPCFVFVWSFWEIAREYILSSLTSSFHNKKRCCRDIQNFLELLQIVFFRLMCLWRLKFLAVQLCQIPDCRPWCSWNQCLQMDSVIFLSWVTSLPWTIIKRLLLLLCFLGFSLHCPPPFQNKNSSENTFCRKLSSEDFRKLDYWLPFF